MKADPPWAKQGGESRVFTPMLFQTLQLADSSPPAATEAQELGLAISRQLVELMDGRIGVVDAEGDGSVFWVELRQ